MTLDTLVNTVTLADGLAGASQSLLLPRTALGASPAHLANLGDAYLRFLNTLPLLSLSFTPHRVCVGVALAPRRLPLLCFASPYLASHRGGRELRYPIVGGLMARAAGGHLAFGVGPEGDNARLWVDVLDYRPRLGLGLLYLLTQVQLHRLITVAFLRHAVAAERCWSR
jgi:hypothetical protein